MNLSNEAAIAPIRRKKPNMATQATPINTVPVPEKITKKIKVFSAETLAPAETTYTYEFLDAASTDEAIARLASFDPQTVSKRMLLALNGVLNFFAAREARSNSVGDGIPRKALLKALGGFRTIEPFASMVSALPKSTEYSTQRKAQTEAILEAVRGNAALKTMIVSGITASDDEGDEEEGSEE